MIQIGEKPSPTFAQPLELLSDCHRRVEKFLRALLIVSEQARGEGLSPLQRAELETALRYFREAAPKHTADEEESLFPRMKKVESEEVEHVLQRIAALEGEHQVAKVAHEAVEMLGQIWLKDNRLSDQDRAELDRNLSLLADIYSHHIQIEDNEVFPVAKRVLTKLELQEIGREMAARRGQPFPLNAVLGNHYP